MLALRCHETWIREIVDADQLVKTQSFVNSMTLLMLCELTRQVLHTIWLKVIRRTFWIPRNFRVHFLIASYLVKSSYSRISFNEKALIALLALHLKSRNDFNLNSIAIAKYYAKPTIKHCLLIFPKQLFL